MHLYHNSRESRFRTPFGAAPTGAEVTLSIEAEVPQGTEVLVRLWQSGESLVPMTEAEPGLFRCSFPVAQTPGLLWYYFLIRTPEGICYYGKTEDSSGGAGALSPTPPESWQITVYEPVPLPDWYGNAVAYQIFPERFHRGADWLQRQADAAHPEGWKGTKRMVMQDWNDTPFYCKDPEGKVVRWPFFGGTLEGIREKLPYLQSMGVGVLYLNPIFLASSNHKYDTADYLKIDPGFGDEESFSRLCREAEAAGIRILLDGVFSHTGDDSIYFNRFGNYPEPGAYSRSGSPYDRWYRFGTMEPCGYECWWGVDSLPNVEEENPEYQDLICGEDGVSRKWLRLGASGWRLDVADELPDDFIQKIRQAEHAEKDDALLLGEVWEDATNKVSYNTLREYLLGSELDCTMHYPFRSAALEFLLGTRSAEEYAEAMEVIRENYPPSAFYGALNLIGTHDTPRILTVLGEAPEGLPAGEQEVFHLEPERRDLAKKRLHLLQTLQFTSPGVPCVYYGDEAGMDGFADPFNRGTFPWGKEDQEITGWVRQLSHLRQEYPVLVRGGVSFRAPEKDVLIMTRTLDDAQAVVLINRGGAGITLPWDGMLRMDLLTSRVDAGKTLELPPMTVRILYREGADPEVFSPLPAAAKTPAGRGLLCPVFSLPGKQSVGTLRDALSFLDAVKAAGYDSWMLLPLCPVGIGSSPYSSLCVFAGDPRLIDPDWAVDMDGFDAFCRENDWWLADYALFQVLHDLHGTTWQQWPKAERDREDLPGLRSLHAEAIHAVMETQYRFYAQWSAVREKAAGLGIDLIGDIPIYAAVDSAETWSCREQFQLDETGFPAQRAGCPPDYFSPDGQDWGNPVYNWPQMRADGYQWWKRRLRQAFHSFDYVRLDHFRSFAAYYSIPSDKTAKEGNWIKGAGIAFFRAMVEEFGTLPMVAEDLGTLDDSVYVLLRHTGLSGMNVWQFSAHELPHMEPEVLAHRVLFSGTHDNQTLRGFLEEQGIEKTPQAVLTELLAMPAAAVILPVQDVLGLDDAARINVPGVAEGNWTWRMTKEQLSELRRGGILANGK